MNSRSSACSSSVVASRAKSILTLRCEAQAGREQRLGDLADLLKAGADRLAVLVAGVDALGDDGELERGQAEVEAEGREVALAVARVPADDLVLGQVAGRLRRVGDGRAELPGEPL